jgi:hypothetical protein
MGLNMRFRCRGCGSELKYPTQYCLFCGERNADFCFVYMGEKVHLIFFSVRKSVITEEQSFKIYPEPESIRNTFELIAENIHWRRIDSVMVAGDDEFKAELCAELVSKYRLSEIRVQCLGVRNLYETVENIKRSLKLEKKLKKVEVNPDDKIGGAHSTIIGGREGRKLLHRLAKCEYVKKIVPGVIEGCGASSGGGVRLKLTRSDERGNLRAILIDGTSVQSILVITTASNREEGEFIKLLLKDSMRNSKS